MSALVVIGASTFITVDPNGPFSKFTVLPMQIFQWTTRPQAEFKHIAAAASIVLLLLAVGLGALSAALGFGAAVMSGACMVVRRKFSASRFLPEVRELFGEVEDPALDYTYGIPGKY